MRRTILLMSAIWCLLLASCITEPVRQAFEQITADIEANEISDALAVSKAATEKYGKAQAIITPQTTARTVQNIRQDWAWQDYAGGLFGWLTSASGGLAGTGLLSVVLASLVAYLRKRSKTLAAENEDMVQAIDAKGDETLKMDVAERQAKRMPLHKKVKELEKG